MLLVLIFHRASFYHNLHEYRILKLPFCKGPKKTGVPEIFTLHTNWVSGLLVDPTFDCVTMSVVSMGKVAKEREIGKSRLLIHNPQRRMCSQRQRNQTPNSNTIWMPKTLNATRRSQDHLSIGLCCKGETTFSAEWIYTRSYYELCPVTIPEILE